MPIMKDTLDNIQKEVSIFKANSEVHKSDLLNAVSNGSLTLCIGSGVTRGLVGEWNDLLNEIASSLFYRKIMEKYLGKDNSNGAIGLTGSDVHDFLNNLWGGFPDTTNVLEKGEYLAAQCDKGPLEQKKKTQCSDSFDTTPNWRELVFAEITLDVSRWLIANNISKNMRSLDPSKEKNVDLAKLEEYLIDYYLEMVNHRDEISKKGQTMAKDDCFRTIETLEAIISLCFSGKVRHIINYNFDTILETLLSSEKVSEYYKPKGGKSLQLEVYNPFYNHENPLDIFIGNTIPEEHHSIRIDHVHGLLDGRLEQISPIVFSEESYVSIRRAALHWSSLAIAKAITEGLMLCIGFSGEDDDFRTICQRMMENKQMGCANMEAPMNYKSHIYLVASLKSRIGKIRKPLEKKIEERSHLVGTEPEITDKEKICTHELFIGYIEMVEQYFKNHFDVQIIWVEDRPNIPTLLQELNV